MRFDGNSRSLQLGPPQWLQRSPCLYCQPPRLSTPPKLIHWAPVSHQGQHWGYSSPARLTHSAIRGFMLPRAQIWHDAAGLRKTRWWLVCDGSGTWMMFFAKSLDLIHTAGGGGGGGNCHWLTDMTRRITNKSECVEVDVALDLHPMTSRIWWKRNIAQNSSFIGVKEERF